MKTQHDPVADHVHALGRALRGPSRLRRSMLAETRDGLRDATAAHEEGGLPTAEAAARAVRDFGPVREIAPLYQDELAARQGRRTAVLLAVSYPGLMVGWSLLWEGGIGWSGPSIPLVSALAVLQDVVSWVVGIAALAALMATFRRRSPRRTAMAVGTIGVVGTALCGGAAAVMILGSGRAGSPALVTGYGVSAAVLVVTLWSVTRTLRAARALTGPGHDDGITGPHG